MEIKLKGLIIINAYVQQNSFIEQANRLKEEFENLGVEIEILRNDFFYALIDGCDVELRRYGYHFVVYLDKDKYISKMIEKCDISLFNRSESIEYCDDKMLTYIMLANNGIKMCKTLPGLLCYTPDVPIAVKTLEVIIKELCFPLVLKQSYGSLGKNVFLINSKEELLTKMEEVIFTPHLFQQYIKTSHGRDVRVILVGGKIIASMLRTSKTDFRSNVGLGGVGENYELPDTFVEMSEKVAKILKLDYCGIDILFGENNEPILCEVNSNAFFAEAERVTGVNIARVYANHIISKLATD